jgi:hypothetical protein
MFSDNEINYKRYSGLGDFGKGFNISSITKPFQNVTRAVTSVVRPVIKTVQSAAAPVVQAAKSVVSNPITLLNPAMGVTAGLNQVATSIPVVGNVVGSVEKAATGLVSKVPVVGGIVSGAAGMALGIPPQQKMVSSDSGDSTEIYQDEQGNVITKEQYDQLMSQQSPTTVYQDAQGNVITEAQYNTLMSQQGLPSVQSSPNQMSYAPMYQSPSGQVLQPTELQTEPDNSDQPVSSAPALDPLSQKVYDTLSQIQAKIAAGQPLTKQENDFVQGIDMAMKSNQSLSLIPNVTPVQTSTPKSFSGDFEWKMEGFGGLGTLPSFNRQRINFKGVIR